jgi:diguanylate cyclase (GGDEF)-like protein
MDLLSLPDIAAMLILMGVLDWLRRKHRDSSVKLWMLGLTFILLETVAVAVLHGSVALSRAAHAFALNAYIFAAMTFGWAAREDVIPGLRRVPLFLPAALPLFIIATMYGLNVLGGAAYLEVTACSLGLGILYVLTFVRLAWRVRMWLLLLHCVVWAPMTWMAARGELRGLVYWGLGCLYLLVAISFRKRARGHGIGGIVIIAGFVVWAACFFVHPIVRDRPLWNGLNEQVWTMQKFLVIIGMLLVLLEDQATLLQDQALHDALTGLPNRRLFEDRLVQSMERTRRTGRSAAMFVIDLDNFKQINDGLGHRMGDLVLERTSQTLKSKLRGSDTLARCGGDEFHVIVNDLQRPEDCEIIAETLRAAIRSVDVPPEVAPLRGSIGWSLFPDDVSNAGELWELADVRMYKDKRTRSSIARARTV